MNKKEFEEYLEDNGGYDGVTTKELIFKVVIPTIYRIEVELKERISYLERRDWLGALLATVVASTVAIIVTLVMKG